MAGAGHSKDIVRSVTHGEHSSSDVVDRYTRINWQARVAAVGSIEVEVRPLAIDLPRNFGPCKT